LSISNSVASIEADAFAANQLTSVTIPEGVTYIGDGAFSGGQNYKFDSGVQNPSISDNEFRFNRLTSVTIPGSVTSIGSGAFLSNPLTRVTISEGVTSIGRMAFASSRLTSITIPNSVTSIGDMAFSNDNRLTSVTIPANVQLGSSVFDDIYGKDVPFLFFLPISIDNIPVRNRFETIYNKNGKKAGTYVKNKGKWSYEG
jgi:hypothetical protein